MVATLKGWGAGGGVGGGGGSLLWYHAEDIFLVPMPGPPVADFLAYASMQCLLSCPDKV